MKLSEILVGKRVKATDDCNDVKMNEIYKVEVDKYGKMFILNGDGRCYCVETWELIDPISYKLKSHKHNPVCKDCGEIIKKYG